MEKKIVIAIDGHAGCGKSSTAKIVASQLGYLYIDSGAMYRAVTLYFIRNQIDLTQPGAVAEALKHIRIGFTVGPAEKMSVTLNQEAVEAEIRSMAVNERVSQVSAIPAVRRFLVAQQQEIGKQKGIVMDGRDIGTVVFPHAELKVFMSADVEERARRRQKELLEKGEQVPLAQIVENLADRDRQDSSRADSPLKKADDAVVVDTTNLPFEQQVAQVLQLARERM